ncbi:MAG: hypothetical protein E7005_01875 [Alphaproteobacteria bacterium]|nr:hypothetical protein [Alphaproteobacteria bacterium]
MAFVSFSAFAESVPCQGVKPKFVDKETFLVNGEKYVLYEYDAALEGFRDSLSKADVLFICDIRSERNGGDWSRFIEFDDGTIGISYHTKYWKFNKDKTSYTLVSRRSTGYKSLYYDEHTNFGEVPFSEGKKMGYTYVDGPDKSVYLCVYFKK